MGKDKPRTLDFCRSLRALHDRAHPPDAITTSATKISRLDPLVIALILSFLSDGLGCLAAKIAGDVIEPMG